MKLFLISQDINQDYETYDSAVVVAESEQDARTIHPSEFVTHTKNGKWMGTYTTGGEYETENCFASWVNLHVVDQITVKEIGLAHPTMSRGVVCASFNAG